MHKPVGAIDDEELLTFRKLGSRLEGGLGDAVLETLTAGDERAPVVKRAVCEIPESGTPAELLHGTKLDADAIADAAQKLVATPA